MSTQHLAHCLRWLETEEREYEAFLRDVVATEGRRVWTTDLQVRRAHVFHVTYRLLTVLDARFGSLRATSVAPQIASIFLQQRGSPAAFTAADEAASDVLWSEHQYPTFTLTAGLAANLLLTDPGKVLERDVPWPFPSFRVVLPHPSPIQFLDSQERVTDMLDFRILQWQSRGSGGVESSEQIERINLVPLHSATSLETFRRGLVRVLDEVFQVIERTPAEPAVLLRGYGPSGVSVFQNQKWLGDRNVQEWLDGDLMQRPDSPLSPVLPMMAPDVLAVAAAQRIAVNLALWLCSRDEKTGRAVWTETKPKEGDPRPRNWGGRAIREGLARGSGSCHRTRERPDLPRRGSGPSHRARALPQPGVRSRPGRSPPHLHRTVLTWPGQRRTLRASGLPGRGIGMMHISICARCNWPLNVPYDSHQQGAPVCDDVGRRACKVFEDDPLAWREMILADWDRAIPRIGQRCRVQVLDPSSYASGFVQKIQGKTGRIEDVRVLRQYMRVGLLLRFDEPITYEGTARSPTGAFWFESRELIPIEQTQ